MKYTYIIEGMTCSGCKTSVEEKLGLVGGVESVKVNIEKSEVEVKMSKHISTLELQNSLPSKYAISEKQKVTHQTSNDVETKSDLQRLFPLFLIFGYIIAASILLNLKGDISGFMLDFMGLFYIVFSFFKFLDLKGFPESFKMYDPLAKRIPIYGWVYPFLELILGLLFLTRTQVLLALIATIIILGITTAGVTKILLDKKSIQCACLGTALKLPMTKATFIENTVMLVMATLMLLMG